MKRLLVALGLPAFAVILFFVLQLMLAPVLLGQYIYANGQTALDCLSCHAIILESHNKLGSGNKACLVCHDSAVMERLRLADGTPLSLSYSAPLCGQCHQSRYDAWKEGTHGTPGPLKSQCVDCHSPHAPQIVLTNITKLHPATAPPPPGAPVWLWVILGASLLAAAVVGVAMVRKSKRT